MFLTKDQNELNVTYEVLLKEITNRIIGSKTIKKQIAIENIKEQDLPTPSCLPNDAMLLPYLNNNKS